MWILASQFLLQRHNKNQAWYDIPWTPSCIEWIGALYNLVKVRLAYVWKYFCPTIYRIFAFFFHQLSSDVPVVCISAFCSSILITVVQQISQTVYFIKTSSNVKLIYNSDSASLPVDSLPLTNSLKLPTKKSLQNFAELQTVLQT